MQRITVIINLDSMRDEDAERMRDRILSTAYGHFDDIASETRNDYAHCDLQSSIDYEFVVMPTTTQRAQRWYQRKLIRVRKHVRHLEALLAEREAAIKELRRQNYALTHADELDSIR